MDSFTLVLILLGVCSSILAVFYVTLLVHILRGNKNVWLTWQVIMLLAVNLANIVALYPNIALYYTDNATMAAVWCLALTWMVTDFGFCVAHYLLAMKYRQLSVNVPVLIDKKPELPYSKWDSIQFWTLLSLNAGMPLF
jgi:hypothetical protein